MLYGELPSCGQRLLWSQNSTPLQEMSPLRGGQQAAGAIAQSCLAGVPRAGRRAEPRQSRLS